MSYKRYHMSCLLCKLEISTTQFERHYNSKTCKDGKKFIKIDQCLFCERIFDGSFNNGNHVKWCTKNPNRGKGVLDNTNNGSQLNTEEAIRKRATKIKQAHRDGKYKDAPQKAVETRKKNSPDGVIRMSDESKENSRKAALKSTHQRVSKRTHKFIDKIGREFMFDSSWEDALAIRLDELDIKWDRPSPIKYEHDNKIKNYFPDFYLLDHNIFIDPKNSYVEKQQKIKLDIVSKLINLVILRTKRECETFTI